MKTLGLPWQCIESANNPKLKQLQRLVQDPQRLKQQRMAVMEGLHGLVAVLEHLCAQEGAQGIQTTQASVALLQVVVPEPLLQHPEWPRAQAALLHWVQHAGPSPTLPLVLWQVPAAVYKKLSLQTTPTGPMLLLQVLPSPVPLNAAQDVLVLDGIQDPGNVGTLLRTAAAVGLRQVVCSQDTAWWWSDKALRAGMGAQLALQGFTEDELLSSLERTPMPVRITSLAPHPKRAWVFDADLRPPGVWVFGHEGQGVRPAWQQRATDCIHIPQSPWVESLNVAASAAVCLYEQWRQRR